MKKILTTLLYISLAFILSACNNFIVPRETMIETETLNYISTVVINSNLKVNTSTYEYVFGMKKEGPVKGSGSGVVIKKETINYNHFYYILTNYHVIMLDDKYHHDYKVEDIYSNIATAEVVAMDKKYDLAILKFQSNQNIEVMKLANEDPIVGQLVFSIGNPSGKQNIITAGKILSFQTIDKVEYPVIVHEAVIKNGSSGSMLINEEYKIVGLNTWGFTEDKNSDAYVKGGATPVMMIRQFLAEQKFEI